jgi:hypothetical protein
VKGKMARTEVLGRREVQNFPDKNTSDFRLEYGKHTPDQAAINDIVSFLGEYYFHIPKYSYELEFSGGEIKDPLKEESMLNIAEKAIYEKIVKNSTYSRELAEKHGIQSLNNQLSEAQNGDTIFWTSPPGPKEEGYGDYGFVFMGNVHQTSTGKDIQMTAIHIDNPTLEQFNQANYLFTGEKIGYETAEEFIANPRVIKEYFDEGYIDALLGKTFSFKSNKEEQEKFNIIMQKMSPLYPEFVQLAKDSHKPKSEKIQALYSIINYALQLKKEYDRPFIGGERTVVDFKPIPNLAVIAGRYGYEPPKVAGSCPNSSNDSSLTSSNLLSRNSFINKLSGEDEMDYEFDQDGPCKKCFADTKCGPCGICKACDLTIRAGSKFS